MKVVIAGPRDFVPSSAIISKAIQASGFNITELVCGGAPGVDSGAEMYCYDRGIPTTGADYYVPRWVWLYVGRKAGPIRNSYMAEYGDALIVIRDKISAGTNSMIKEMTKKKKPVYVYDVREKS